MKKDSRLFNDDPVEEKPEPPAEGGPGGGQPSGPETGKPKEDEP